jgi:ATP-dependent protease ClpP protease subunit
MGKKPKNFDSVWSWFDHNVDLESRTIYMGSLSSDFDSNESGVDHLMAEYIIKGIHLLESRSDDDITIIMNNPGGDWYHGLAIYDAVKYSICHCTIRVYGHAMSMGSLILQAADSRVMMPNSKFMIHYGYNGSVGHTKSFERSADESKRIGFQMENIYLDEIMKKEKHEGHGHIAKVMSRIINRLRAFEINPTLASYKFSKNTESKREEIREVLKEMLNFDTYLDAQETVDLGLADQVFGEEE